MNTFLFHMQQMPQEWFIFVDLLQHLFSCSHCSGAEMLFSKTGIPMQRVCLRFFSSWPCQYISTDDGSYISKSPRLARNLETLWYHRGTGAMAFWCKVHINQLEISSSCWFPNIEMPCTEYP